MAIVDGLTTLPELKSRLHLSQGDADDDALLESLITSVSRQIELHTGHTYTATTLTRVYTACESYLLLLPRGHDLLSVTTLATDADADGVYETTWAPTDYALEPANAAQEQRPYWAICTRYGGHYAFPAGVQRGVQVSGSWGWWTAVPAVVQEACLLQCELAYQNTNTAGQPLAGAGEYSQSLTGIGLHPFVRRLLDYDREGGAW